MSVILKTHNQQRKRRNECLGTIRMGVRRLVYLKITFLGFELDQAEVKPMQGKTASRIYIFTMSFPSRIFSKSLRVFTNSWTASEVTPLQERKSRRISDGKSLKKDKHLSDSLAQPLRRNSFIDACPQTLSISWSVIPGQKLRSSFFKSRQCCTSKRRVEPVMSLPERKRVDNLRSGL